MRRAESPYHGLAVYIIQYRIRLLTTPENILESDSLWFAFLSDTRLRCAYRKTVRITVLLLVSIFVLFGELYDDMGPASLLLSTNVLVG